jgi:large subunit ribosomal protein L17
MRHNNTGRKLGRNSSHRSAMMRNMVTSLLEHENITTTVTRAKELRKIAEKMISLGKRGDLHARRQALQVIRDGKVVGKLFEMIGPRYANRPGGYTRILKTGNRLGDNAPVCIIELVEEEFTPRIKKQAPAIEESVAASVAPAAVIAEEVVAEETVGEVIPPAAEEDEKE